MIGRPRQRFLARQTRRNAQCFRTCCNQILSMQTFTAVRGILPNVNPKRHVTVPFSANTKEAASRPQVEKARTRRSVVFSFEKERIGVFPGYCPENHHSINVRSQNHHCAGCCVSLNRHKRDRPSHAEYINIVENHNDRSCGYMHC